MNMIPCHLVAYVRVGMRALAANDWHARVKKRKRGLVMDTACAGVLRMYLVTEIVLVMLVGQELCVTYRCAHMIAIQEGNASSASVYVRGAGLASHAIN